MDITNLLHCKLFEGLNEHDIKHIVKDLQTITASAGDNVITEHAHGDYLYVILRGSVEISKLLAEPDAAMSAQLKLMQVGDFFGEMSLLDDEPRSADVIAKEDCELLIIPRQRFMEIAFSSPTVLFNLIKALSWRLRDTNQRFIDAMDKLIAQNRLMAIGMAASKIIHDIKTPLTVIVLTAQLIENLNPDTNDFTESIIRQTKTIDQMVREILDFAKGTSTPINPQDINLAVFLNDVRETFNYTIQGRKITFELHNDVQKTVRFDDSKIRRILLNLLKNSLEAIGEMGYIHLDAYLEEGKLVFIVRDNGPGVSARLKPNLFSPFQSEGKTHGTGLGLAICQKMVQEHKGTIEYRDNEPHGAIFTIRLPQS